MFICNCQNLGEMRSNSPGTGLTRVRISVRHNVWKQRAYTPEAMVRLNPTQIPLCACSRAPPLRPSPTTILTARARGSCVTLLRRSARRPPRGGSVWVDEQVGNITLDVTHGRRGGLESAFGASRSVGSIGLESVGPTAHFPQFGVSNHLGIQSPPLLIAHGEGGLRMNTPRGQCGWGRARRVGVIAIVLHREWNAVDAARGAQKPLMSRSCLG